MDVVTSTVGAEVWITVTGRIDVLETSALTEQIDDQLAKPVARLVLDLAGVEYLDSAGLAVLVRSWRHQQQHEREFAVVMPSSDAARRIFDLAGFDAVFETTNPS